MWIFKLLTSMGRKLLWLFSFISEILSPFYKELVKIITEVANTDLENEDAKKAVFQKITDYIQSKGINVSDSLLNLVIEIVYQLYKKGRA